MCCIYDIVSLLNNYIVKYSLLFPLVQKVLKKYIKKYGSYSENKVARLLWAMVQDFTALFLRDFVFLCCPFRKGLLRKTC